MMSALSPAARDQIEAALTLARRLRGNTVSHPSGRALHPERPHDADAIRSVAVGRHAFATGGAVVGAPAVSPAIVGVPTGAPPWSPPPRMSPLDAALQLAGRLNPVTRGDLALHQADIDMGARQLEQRVAQFAQTGLGAAPARVAYRRGGPVDDRVAHALRLAHHALHGRPKFEYGGSESRGYGGGDNEPAGGWAAADAAQDAAQDAADDARGWGGGEGTSSRSESRAAGFNGINVGSVTTGQFGGLNSGSNYGGGLGNIGVGAGAGTGGYGIGGFGGAVGSVASGGGDSSSDASGDNWSGGWNSMNVGGDNTIGRAVSSIGSLGSNNYGFAALGGGGNGSIGLSGMATGAGTMSSGGDGSPAAGFGNFSAGATDDGLGGFTEKGYGADNPFSGVMSAVGYNPYSGFSALNNNLGGASMDTEAMLSRIASNYGHTSDGNMFGARGVVNSGQAYNGSDAAFAAAAAANPAAVASPYGALNGFNVGAASQPAPAGLGVLGAVPTAGVDATPAAPVSPFGGLKGFRTAADAASQPVSTFGFTANPSGQTVGPDGSLTGFGVAGVGDSPALTVHGVPGFASGVKTGDEAPAELGNRDLVRNFALSDLAANLGADYGRQLGLPDGFHFSDPAAVAAVVGAAQNAESTSNPAAVNPSSLATGLGQMLGTGKWSNQNPGPYSGSLADPGADRLSSMLGFLGRQADADPASLDPRAVGIDAAQAALGTLPGTYTNQVAYGLAQLARNPMYASSLQAVESPNRPIAGIEAEYTRGFENPSISDANLIGRENVAMGLHDIGRQQIAGLGGIGTANVAYGTSSPPVSAFDGYSEPVGLADNYAAMTALAAAGYPATSIPAALGPVSKVADEQTYAQKAGMPALTGNDGFSTYTTGFTPSAAPDADTWNGSGLDPAGLDALAGLQADPGKTYATGTKLGAYTDAMAAMPGDIPSIRAMQLASQQAGYDPNTVIGAPATDGRDTSLSDQSAADPLTVTPGAAPAGDGVTPSYLPGQKTAVKTALNVAAGLVPFVGIGNTISGLLGGPTVGGYIADHSSPGEAANPSGNGNGRGGTGGYDTYNYLLSNTPGSGAGSVGTGSSRSTVPAVYSANEAATAAYLNALRHQSPGPAARLANAVPLVAPRAATRSIYNPMGDPGVLAALAAARGYA